MEKAKNKSDEFEQDGILGQTVGRATSGVGTELRCMEKGVKQMRHP